MAYEVQNAQEIYLNGYKYRAKSPIVGSFISSFPGQLSIGGDQYNNQLELSSLIFDNLTGGIGTEKFVSPNMCWFTDCIIEYPGHILPPRLATSLTSPTMTSAVTNALDTDPDELGFETVTQWKGDIAQEGTQQRTGTYCGEIATTDTTKTGYIDITFYSEYQGKSVSLEAYVKLSNVSANHAHITIDDGVDTTESAAITLATYARYTITHTMNAAATRLRIICTDTSADGVERSAYFDDLVVTVLMDGTTHFINYNDRLWMAKGSVLSRLNSGRTAFETIISDLPAPVKAFVPSLNNCAYIGLGDTHHYNFIREIEDCNDIWNELIDTDATVAISGDAVQFTIAAGMAAGDIIATEVIASSNLSRCTDVFFDMECSISVSAGDFCLLLDDTASCASPKKTINIPALTANTRKLCVISLDDASALTAIISIGIENNVDVGACTLKIWPVCAIDRATTANFNWGADYDAKLFRMNTSGTVAYSTDPNAAAPTWTSGAAITDIAEQIEGFVVGRDASGNSALYVPTHSKLKIFDADTPQWLDTEVVLPDHPNGGKGATYFNGKLYLSYGLAVKEYYPENGSVIDVGLTERDGLPVEFNGEIVKLQGESGVKRMFALVDASQVTGTAKSGLYAFNGSAWYCWWKDTANNGAMGGCIVSSASSGYAVYWEVGDKVYYTNIPRGIQNPDKITQYYGTAGVFLSPWFDAGDQGAAKLAKVLADFAKGVTTTETVALKYRIDHTNTDLDTGWTTLDTLNTTAETGYNEELFGSGAGIAYKSIQLRMDFVTAGSTAKADVQTLKLLFRKRTGDLKIRRWIVDVLLDDYANGPTGNEKAKAKIANLKTVLTSSTDVVFCYRPNAGADESYYVNAECERFEESSGPEYPGGYYRLVLTEV